MAYLRLHDHLSNELRPYTISRALWTCCGVVGSNSDSFVTFPTFLPFIPVVRLGNRRHYSPSRAFVFVFICCVLYFPLYRGSALICIREPKKLWVLKYVLYAIVLFSAIAVCENYGLRVCLNIWIGLWCGLGTNYIYGRIASEWVEESRIKYKCI